jgi:sugar/nucleoside kinase (ribokinase family)
MMLAYGNPVYDHILTPWVSTRERVLSGCATNAAMAVARLGGRACVVGRVGADRIGHYHQVFGRLGIDHRTELCAESGGFRLDYDRQGRRDLRVLGQAEAISNVTGALSSADLVFVGPVLQETPFELIREIRERSSATMVLDPQGLLRRIGNDGQIEHFKPAGIEEICGLFDIVKPNELETKVLTGIDPRENLEGAASMLIDWGIPTVVITLAELGALIVSDGIWYRFGAIPTLAVDSTGAGDTFAGGLMFALEQGMGWEAAGRLATAVSSIMIEQCGPEFELTFSDAKKRAATVDVTVRQRTASPVS